MKNTMKMLGIIAIVAVIGITMAACDTPKDYTHTFEIINVTDYVYIPGYPLSRGPGSVIVKIKIDDEIKNVNIPVGGTETITIHKNFTLQEHNDHLFTVIASSSTADVAVLNSLGNSSKFKLYVTNGLIQLQDPR